MSVVCTVILDVSDRSELDEQTKILIIFDM